VINGRKYNKGLKRRKTVVIAEGVFGIKRPSREIVEKITY
jgi:hypothetical protein